MSRNTYNRDDASTAAVRFSAEYGSKALRDAIEERFAAFARNRGISFEDARLLCVNSEGAL